MLFKKLYAKLPVLLSLQSNRKIQSVARDSVFVGKEWLLQELRKTLALRQKSCHNSTIRSSVQGLIHTHQSFTSVLQSQLFIQATNSNARCRSHHPLMIHKEF